jgi:ABC-type lipoprotein release transport system permease subunit
MIWTKLVLGGLGRRGLEAFSAAIVLVLAIAIVAGSLMVVDGARAALARAERQDRPDVIHVKSRFNRALFETPQSGMLQPMTLPVYEPLIDPQQLATAAGEAKVVKRQSLLRNVVSPDSFLNVYIFGIEPEAERQVSMFELARGRFLRSGDKAAAVVDEASVRALGIDLGEAFSVRKADGTDAHLAVVGILRGAQLHYPPPQTIKAPELTVGSSAVSGGVFITLGESEEIFGRSALTDALVIARAPSDVPKIVGRLREAFRLEPGIFIEERYGQFRRRVRDFSVTLALFTAIGITTAVLAGGFVANLLDDVYADRRRQYATLIALGFSPIRAASPALYFGLAMAMTGGLAGSLFALSLVPARFSMPSLMTDLGTIEPRFDSLVAGVAAAVGVIPVMLAIAPTAWWLLRRSVAGALSESGR